MKQKQSKISNSYFSALVILASWPLLRHLSKFFLPPSIESKKKEGKYFWSYLRILSLLLQGTFLVYSFQINSFFSSKMEVSFFFLMFVIGLLALEARTSVYWEPKRRFKKKQRYWTSVATPFVSVFPCATVRPSSSSHLFHPFYFKSKFVLCKKKVKSWVRQQT